MHATGRVHVRFRVNLLGKRRRPWRLTWTTRCWQLPLPGLVRTLYVIRRDGRSLSVAAQGLLDLLLAHPVRTTAPV